jgi:hypothetical protein
LVPNLRGWMVMAVVLLGLGAPAAHAAAILRAHVQFTGKVPRMGALKRTDPACGGNKFAMEEDVVVGATGGLKNVLVYVSKGGAAAGGGRAKDAELSTQACMVRPRVTAMTQNGMLRVNNADTVGHLWHGFAGVKTAFLEQQAPGSQPLVKETKLQPGEFLRLRDDLKPWMAGFVVVTDNPFFAATNDLGDALVMDLPPGQYTVTAWHERYGAKSVELTVGADGYADARFSFDGTEPRP